MLRLIPRLVVCTQSLPHVTLPGKLGKGPQQGVRCHPYQTLLQMYLSKFLPRNAAPASGESISMTFGHAGGLLLLCSCQSRLSQQALCCIHLSDSLVCPFVVVNFTQYIPHGIDAKMPSSATLVTISLHMLIECSLEQTATAAYRHSCIPLQLHAVSAVYCHSCMPPQLLLDLPADAGI